MKPKLLESEDTLAGKPEAALDDTVEFSFLEDTQDLELLLEIEDAESIDDTDVKLTWGSFAW